jgi:RNA polymerase sigma-70 factor (ECF subfamily)
MNFEETYWRYNKLVFNLALQYVQNIEDAEEVTQDVFVSVHKSIHTFQEHAELQTWIYRITINQSLDYLKAQKRKKRFAFITSIFYDGGREVQNKSHTFNHPGILLEQKEALETLFKLINSLPNNQKTVLILSKLEQKNQKEVAEIMGISTKAVESLLQRAKKNLSGKLNTTKDR